MHTIPVRQINTAGTLQTTGRFSIRSLQQVLNGKDLVHELHRHDFYFMLAVEKGAGLHSIDFTDYPVQEGSFFILRPGQVHRLELAANSTGFLLEFDHAFYQPATPAAEQRWKKACAQNFCRPEKESFEKMLLLLSQIADEYAAKDSGYKEAITACLDLLLITYIRQSENVNSINNTDASYTRDRYEKFMQLLENNISKMKTVAQYASQLHLSPYQLNAITKSAVGKTVSDCINEQIVLEAKRYLLATNNQVKDIAGSLGYEDASYFIRFFRKQTGLSPDAFRRNFK